jgi:TDG/mug DNA glycosylase family protein
MRPSKQEITAAEGRKVPDVIAPYLHVLFCGINPGLYSAAVGHHFARPGNRFWKALRRGGFTNRLLEPFDDELLPSFGLGITNLVERATSTADSLGQEELRAGAEAVRRKAHEYKPHVIAFLGVCAYRIAFGSARAQLGLQQTAIGNTRLWVLPNPSGLNAHYQIDLLGAMFENLRIAEANPGVPEVLLGSAGVWPG